jgi:hypothetical protein
MVIAHCCSAQKGIPSSCKSILNNISSYILREKQEIRIYTREEQQTTSRIIVRCSMPKMAYSDTGKENYN